MKGPGCPAASHRVGPAIKACLTGGCADMRQVQRGDGGDSVHNGPVGMPENTGASEASGRFRPRSSQRVWRMTGQRMNGPWMNGGTKIWNRRKEAALHGWAKNFFSLHSILKQEKICLPRPRCKKKNWEEIPAQAEFCTSAARSFPRNVPSIFPASSILNIIK